MQSSLTDKTIVFCDLDGTLIETMSRSPFPKGVWDCKIKLDVWEKIKQTFPNMKGLFIVTNQGGIEKGYVNMTNFLKKIDWIKVGLKEYFGEIDIEGICCTSNDKNNWYRKPNPGMLESIYHDYVHGHDFDKKDAIMIGDASGKEGDFSDSDLKAAENFGIDYIDVRDLLLL